MISTFSVLENSSFRDLQAIAADHWGVSIQNTCTSAPPHPGWLLLYHQSRAPGHAATHWTPTWCMARSHNHSRAFSWSCSRCPQVCLAPATAYGVAKVWCSRYGCCEARVSHCQFSSVLARCWVGAVAASPKYYPQSQSRPWSPPELEILNLTSLECPSNMLIGPVKHVVSSLYGLPKQRDLASIHAMRRRSGALSKGPEVWTVL